MDSSFVSGLKIPLAVTLLLQFLDINILIFATILIILGLFIDFLIYLNSAPAELPYEREHFIKSTIKATTRWIGWALIFWFLYSTFCAIGTYIGLPEFRYISDYAGITLLTSIILYDLRKLKYTQFYYFKPVKGFVTFICTILGCEDEINQEKQQKRG